MPAGRRRLPVLAAAATLAALGFAAPPAASGAGPAVPAPSVLAGVAPVGLSGAVDLGPVDPRTPIAADVPTASATAQEALSQLVARLSETDDAGLAGHRRRPHPHRRGR